MNFRQIQDLIKIIGKYDEYELSIEEENFKITLKKGNSAGKIPQVSVEKPAMAAQAPEPTGETAPRLVAPKTNNEQKLTTNEKYITMKSPMFGTFYRSPSPDKEPFVKVGDLIHKGDHICIIEAMKLFNEIESEYDGKVVKVLVEDAKPVEYEQPLFLLEPA